MFGGHVLGFGSSDFLALCLRRGTETSEGVVVGQKPEVSLVGLKG